MLLSARDAAAALAIGERIRSAAVAGDVAACTTLSIGIVELPPHAPVALSAALAAADRAMYQSKAQGGNRVRFGTLGDEPARRPRRELAGTAPSARIPTLG